MDKVWTVTGIALVAVLGSLATDIGPWYLSLQQPWWKPPDLIFGPAWMLIYISSGTAIVRAWRRASEEQPRRRILVACVVNGALNVLWSVLFFALRRPDWALFEVGLLGLSILWMMRVLGAVHSPAVRWLLPYLVWVSVAAALNGAVVQLNGPFADNHSGQEVQRFARD